MPKNDALQRIRRFFKTAATKTVDGGVAVVLDGRQPKTPGGHALVLPTQAAAALVAAEWDGQVEWIDFGAMPATRHGFTAIDRVSAVRAETAAELARFAGSDLLCYYAEAPGGLVERQQAQWGPTAWIGLRTRATG